MNTISEFFKFIGSWLKGDQVTTATNVMQVNGEGNSLGINFANTDTECSIGLRINQAGNTAGLYDGINDKFLIFTDPDGLVRTNVDVQSVTPSITATKGTFVQALAFQYGKIVQLFLQVKNTSSIATGTNIFEGTLNTTGLRPKVWTSGGSFLGSYSIGGCINAQGAIVIRNADSRSLSNNDPVSISFTYIIN